MPANRPSHEELVIAVREYLELDIKPLLGGGDMATTDASVTKSLALTNAIAINLLKLLERESLQRLAQLAQEHELLRRLLPAVSADADLMVLNTSLIELIEASDFVDTDGYVLRVLQQISLAKLAIDNPAYSTLRKHRQ